MSEIVQFPGAVAPSDHPITNGEDRRHSEAFRDLESGICDCATQAFECEAWKERNTPNGARVENRDFLDWVTAEYPRGIESSLDVVEAILTSAADKGRGRASHVVVGSRA